MKDNIDLILEAVEHPERFSDRELDSLLADPETRELYALMCRTSDILAEIPEHDVDEEWKRFFISHAKPRFRLMPAFVSRHAAAAIIFIVASLAVVAASIGVGQVILTREEEERAEEVGEPSETINTEGIIVADTIPVAEADETIVFRDEPLGEILPVICRHYGASVSFGCSGAESLRLYFRWDSSLPLPEVVEQLGSFEQIRINLSGNHVNVD